MLVSGVEQSDSIKHIHTYVYFFSRFFSFPFPYEMCLPPVPFCSRIVNRMTILCLKDKQEHPLFCLALFSSKMLGAQRLLDLLEGVFCFAVTVAATQQGEGTTAPLGV